MRPKAEWAIDSEPIRARGIIVKYPIYFTKREKNRPMTQALDTFASYNPTILFIWFKFDNRLILPVHEGVRFYPDL